MSNMIHIGGGWMADVHTKREVPCTVEGIRRRLEETAQEQFIERTVPELFFWSLGLEYVGPDIKFSEGEDGKKI